MSNLLAKALASASAALIVSAAGQALAGDQGVYPSMAPLAQYQLASQADEVAMARSAAPASISGDAEVLTLSALGYETAAKGKNGFVCIVQRAWANDFGDADFWNPKVRSPNCFNAAAARSVLPAYLERTEWVLAGVSKAEMLARTKAEITSGRIGPPALGAMCYMMSKDGYLGDQAGGHWHPHVMFYLPHSAALPGVWGANLPGVPVMGGDVGLDPAVVYFVIVAKWSDGTTAMAGM